MSQITDRIDKLCMDRGWSQYRLAAESGLSQSTIASWYNKEKNISPSDASLRKIAKAFGMNLSTLYAYGENGSGGIIEVTNEQMEILRVMEKYDSTEQKAVLTMLSAIKKS